jgi:hypothetical protein
MLTKWDEPTIRDMVADQARLKMFGSPAVGCQVQKYREAQVRLRNTAAELQQMLGELGYCRQWRLPQNAVLADVGAMDLDDARYDLGRRHQELIDLVAGNFQRDLEAAAQANKVGRIQWLGDRACRFDYFDTERSRTLTRIHERTVKHSHELVDARRVRLPAWSVRKPKRCREIIRVMPPWMQKHSYIVTGRQILARRENIRETDTPNELAAAAHWVGRKFRQAGQQVIHSGAGALRAVSRVPEITMAVLRDPALVIGDFVLTGWED